MLFLKSHSYADQNKTYKLPTPLLAVSLGAALGFLSGIVGIGGGIFLAPMLYFLRAGSAIHIASTASLFILINSIAGLIGQIQKYDFSPIPPERWLLPLVVLVGGQIGIRMRHKFLTPTLMINITATLILIVVFRLGFSLLPSQINPLG